MPQYISLRCHRASPRKPARPTSCRMDIHLSAKDAPKRTMRKRRSYPVQIVSFRDRYASRVIRFSRFRRTAPPHPRATTTANRFCRLPLLLYRSFAPRPSTLAAVENNSLMSLFLRSLSFLERFLLIRGRELHPPFCAPALQNEPSALGGHSRPKTELSRPFGLAGLIGSFHLENAPWLS